MSNDIVKKNDSDIKYKPTPKFSKFIALYNDPNSKTFGNATQSAIQAYNLDPETQYDYARKLGSVNVTKGNIVCRDYLERKGFNYQRFLDVGIKRTIETDKIEWWKAVGQIAGWIGEDQPAAQTVNNTQINVFGATAKESKQWNEQFTRFLETGTTEPASGDNRQEPDPHRLEAE